MIGKFLSVSAFEEQDGGLRWGQFPVDAWVIEGVVVMRKDFFGRAHGPSGESASAYHTSPNGEGLPNLASCSN